MEDNFKITPEDLKEAFSNPTRIKGMALRGGILKVIKEKLREEGLKVIEKESKNLGLPFILEKVKESEWYPAGIYVEIFYILQEKFNFRKKDFAELGEMSAKFSPAVRFLMKYFAIPEKIAKIGAPRLWLRFFDTGEAEVCEFKDSATEGFLIVRLKNFKLHPLHFFYLGYFFLGMAKLVKKFKEATVEEVESPFRGDKYQEYLIKWKH
ncbi:MAG TPA: hypothetical protein VMV66_03195 [Candidatus Humimicrobiaceae bacterium]|nr:hypothetical protein [Candidatus Humimicrobiaceae bacterium]